MYYNFNKRKHFLTRQQELMYYIQNLLAFILVLIQSSVSQPGHYTIDILGWLFFLVGVCPMCFRLFGTILRLYPVDASNASHQAVTTKNVFKYCICPLSPSGEQPSPFLPSRELTIQRIMGTYYVSDCYLIYLCYLIIFAQSHKVPLFSPSYS